jgi:beta-lactamase superfamily II metal-dependent hydrolase
MRKLTACVLVAILALALPGGVAHADSVVPTQAVTTRVVVRATASSTSADIGSLRPGEQAELLGSVPNWYRVRLSNGVVGFVSKRWTRVVPGPGGSFTLEVVDVGTGLGVLVRGPAFSLVYDGGSNDDLARGDGNRLLAYIREVVPTLDAIDHVVLSHPHRDHVELLPDLFSAFQVREVWDSGRLHDICGYRAFLTAVRDEAGVAYHTASEDIGTSTRTFEPKTCYGDSLPAETISLSNASRITTGAPITMGLGATMTFLHADGGSHGSPNENSLVVRLDLGGTRVLFMGDAEAGGRQPPTAAPSQQSIEGALLACCVADLAADVLIVGHHGSMTSSRRAFLEAVNPRFAIVSAGPTRYGSPGVMLPDAVVITELGSRAQVFRTDGNDDACRQNAAKIGPDADGKPGGCDNIRVTITAGGAPTFQIWGGGGTP